MPTFDLNEYLATSGAAGSAVPTGSIEQQTATVQRSLGQQIQSDTEASIALAKAKAKQADIKETLDLNAALLEVDTNQKFAGTLNKLRTDAEANLSQQTSLSDQLETVAVRKGEIERENAGTYNPFKLLVNGLELKKLGSEEQSLLRESITLSDNMKIRAITVADTITQHNASVVVPALERMKADALRQVDQLNVEGIGAALTEVRKGLNETNQDRQQILANTAGLNAEQRAREDQRRQEILFAQNQEMFKIQKERAQLDLAEAKVGNVTTMSPAIDTYVTIAGLIPDANGKNAGAAYMKNVAAKDPTLYNAYLNIGNAISRANAAGKPLTRNDLMALVKQLPVNISGQMLAASGDSKTIDAVSAGFDDLAFRTTAAVTEKYRADNKIGKQQNLTAAQQKQIDITVKRQMDRVSPAQLMGDSADKYRRMAPAEGSFGQLAEGKTLHAVSQQPTFLSRLSQTQRAVVKTAGFKQILEAPVVADGDAAPVYKAFDLMQAAVKSKSLSVPEAADLIAKMYRDATVVKSTKQSAEAEGLVANGFDIRPNSLKVRLGRRADAPSKAFGGVAPQLPKFMEKLMQDYPSLEGVPNDSISTLDMLTGEVDLASSESLMLYYNRRLAATGAR